MPLPKNAKRVFKGIIFDVYQWPQKMFDSTVKTFERVIRRNTVIVLATVGKKIVLLKQQQPGSPWYYDLVGGRVDNPEISPKEYARRELLEETGMEASSLSLYKKFPIRGHVEYDIFLYIARDCKKVSEQNLDGGERITIEYRTLPQLLAMAKQPDFFLNRAVIDHFLKALIDPVVKKQLRTALES